MRTELLLIDGCPHATAAMRLFYEALHSVGLHDQEVVTRTIRTPEEIQATAFAGSPTFTVDGRDLIEPAGAEYGLSCRVYATSRGLRGVPDLATLREALAAASAGVDPR